MTNKTRNRSDVTAIEAMVVEYFRELREGADLDDAADDALAGIESFCVVALKVMHKTDAKKLRDIARTVEIRARLNGTEMIEVQG